MSRRIVVAAIVATAALAPAAGASRIAHYGTVFCYGSESIVGVRVELESGGSHRARWQAFGSTEAGRPVAAGDAASWSDVFDSRASYRLTVGCGGSTARWGTTSVGVSWVAWQVSNWLCYSPYGYCSATR